MWRCPHCGTPQAETARCWVCRRSSTSCATCRNFRHAVAVNIGYCGLDRTRNPLVGDEIRSCWEACAAAIDRSGPGETADPAEPSISVVGSASDARRELPVVTPPAPIGPAPVVAPRFDLSLFADAEL